MDRPTFDVPPRHRVRRIRHAQGAQLRRQLAIRRLPTRVQGNDHGLGAAYFAEAIARIIIVESTTTGTALVLSKVMPYGVAGLLAVWNVLYARHSRRKGERLGAAANA